jgi:dihydrofolate reductase
MGRVLLDISMSLGRKSSFNPPCLGDRKASCEKEHIVRKLIVTENVTLDGVMESPDLSYQSQDLIAVNQANMQAADALLLGRKTYEEFAGFWPFQSDDRTGVASYINNVAKYVISSTLDEVGWHNTTILNGNLADEIAKLKQQSGKDIVVTGSGELVWSLMHENLVDEYRLFIAPTVRGHGKRLFPDGMQATLQPVETRLFDAGVVMIRYRPAPDKHAGGTQ